MSYFFNVLCQVLLHIRASLYVVYQSHGYYTIPRDIMSLLRALYFIHTIEWTENRWTKIYIRVNVIIQYRYTWIIYCAQYCDKEHNLTYKTFCLVKFSIYFPFNQFALNNSNCGSMLSCIIDYHNKWCRNIR